MANSLTYKGEEIALKRPAAPSDKGSVAYAATHVRLFEGTSVPDKDSLVMVFDEISDGNGYTTGGKTITEADWTYDSDNSKITLADQVWTASGGSIESIAGAYIVNAGGDVLAWWELTGPITLASGDDITLDDLTIKFV